MKRVYLYFVILSIFNIFLMSCSHNALVLTDVSKENGIYAAEISSGYDEVYLSVSKLKKGALSWTDGHSIIYIDIDSGKIKNASITGHNMNLPGRVSSGPVKYTMKYIKNGKAYVISDLEHVRVTPIYKRKHSTKPL